MLLRINANKAKYSHKTVYMKWRSDVPLKNITGRAHRSNGRAQNTITSPLSEI